MGEAKRKGKPDPATVEGLMEMARRHANDIYRDNNDPDHQLLPMWTAYSPTEGLMVIATPFEGDDADQAEKSKRRVIILMQLLFAAKGVTAYSFMSEAWTATASKDPAAAKLTPSQRSDRVEVVTMVAADRNGTKKSAAYEIERQPNGAPRLGREPYAEYDSVSGRMLEILDGIPPGPMPDHMKAVVDELLGAIAMKVEPLNG